MNVKDAWVASEVNIDVSLGCIYIHYVVRLLGFLKVRSLLCRVGTQSCLLARIP